MQLEGRAGMIALIERRAEMAGLDLREYLSMSMNTSDEREIQLVLGQMKNPDAHGGIPVHESHAQILGFIGVENRALELLKMNWTILECHHSRFFITGDTPAIGFRLLPDGRPELGFCPNMQDFQMSLPISPQQCLVIHHARVPDGRLWVGRRMIDELNRRMAFSCDKIIISPHRNDHVSSLVREMSLPESQPKFDHNEAKEVWRRIFLGTAGEEKQPT
jgi:hypothetical protein